MWLEQNELSGEHKRCSLREVRSDHLGPDTYHGTLDFTLSELRSHGKVLSREVK